MNKTLTKATFLPSFEFHLGYWILLIRRSPGKLCIIYTFVFRVPDEVDAVLRGRILLCLPLNIHSSFSWSWLPHCPWETTPKLLPHKLQCWAKDSSAPGLRPQGLKWEEASKQATISRGLRLWSKSPVGLCWLHKRIIKIFYLNSSE